MTPDRIKYIHKRLDRLKEKRRAAHDGMYAAQDPRLIDRCRRAVRSCTASINRWERILNQQEKAK